MPGKLCLASFRPVMTLMPTGSLTISSSRPKPASKRNNRPLQPDDTPAESGCDRLSAILSVQLLENVFDVSIDSRLGDIEFVRYLLVAQTGGDKLKHFDLP